MTRNHSFRTSPRLGLVALAALAASVAASADAPLPTAGAVIDRFIEATGGRAAHEKIQNRVTKGTLELPAQGISLSVTVYTARPGLVYSFTDSDVTGPIEKGSDGKVAWEKSVMGGPRILDGQEREDFLRESAFDKYEHFGSYYDKAEVTGVQEVEGHPCFELILTPKSGKPQTHFFDRESGLLRKVVLTLESQMGSMPLETIVEDYREVGGILLPHKNRVKVLGQERVLTVTSVQQNVDLPPDRFKPPAEVEELLARKASPPAQAKP